MGLLNRHRAATPAPATDSASAPDTSRLTGVWTLDPAHSSIAFVARHAMITKVRGTFEDFDGRLYLDGQHPGRSTADVTLKAASLNTRQKQRDQHLRSADFFHVEAHPELSFRSTLVQQLSADTYRLTGDLSIKGVTRPVAWDLTHTGTATDPFGNERAGFEGSTTVDRTDWGLTWNSVLETGGVLVGEKVKLEFDVSAIRAA
ncbi:polyisoprenoid-binding protein [Streptomyces sp. NWU339]|uniref:YceI family protein n=1 Tax=Streptomyces sp. NWU339 TaxID=2185284 RepID=UPI000D67AE81|nr:YceI family protein [Streptomyces sp. NWU339]PWI04506.1 polyisoprenoid-binding protein [Streptomyces sp. NWU339]